MLSDTDLRDVTKATGGGAEYSLESVVSWSRRWEPVFATDLLGLALRLAPDFIMAGEAGISDMKSHADEKARASG
jgi:hypothetical protein